MINHQNAFSSVTNTNAAHSQATTQALVQQRREYFEHLFPDTGDGKFINIHWTTTRVSGKRATNLGWCCLPNN